MNVPSGYSALDLVGFTDKGDYSASANYVKNDLVHYNDKIWKCLIDDTTGIAPTTGVNWDVWIDQSNSLDGLADVEITNAQDGQELSYDGTTQKWKNTSKIQTLTNQVKDMNNVYGSKNLLPFSLADIIVNNSNTSGAWSGNQYTLNGITFTVNDDGTVNVNGTATSNSALVITDNLRLEDRQYIINGCPDGGSTQTYKIDVQIVGGSFPAQDIGEGAIFTASSSNTYRIRIRLLSDTTISNLTFKPMIRLASITDDTYEPYAKTNQQLTTDKVDWDDYSELGAVNYLENQATDLTDSPVTWTVNTEKIITATVASAITETKKTLDINLHLSLSAGTYKLSGCPSGVDDGTTDICRLQLYKEDQTTVIALDTGNGAIFTLASDTVLVCKIRLGNGLVAGTYVFKPMITLVSYNGDYVPYAKSNKELTEELTVEYGNITTTVTMTEWNLHNVKKYGHVVEAQLTCKLGEAVSAWGTLATIPIGFRPPSGNYPLVVGIKGNYTSFVNLQIAPNGSIQPAISLNSGETIRMDIAYIV